LFWVSNVFHPADIIYIVLISFQFEIQLGIDTVLSKPAITYGSETWVLRAYQKRTETDQIMFWSVLGVTMRDKIRSEEIWKRL